MNIKRRLVHFNDVFASFVMLVICLVKVTNQRTIIRPKPWDFQCKNGPEAFPHETDCQR